ncbi:MAG: NAD-dependent epimerase/dehydratase family protein [Planctomycetes bacterium]|nr:NAD-dependent epimerase/dehydratase family protein [Planctomycetota bacterium]
MRVLVTGAGGFVGSHLVDALLREGVEVQALVRGPNRLGWLQDIAGLKIRYGSLEDIASLKNALAGCTHVFHAAGLVKAPDEATYMTVNAQGTENLLQAVEEAVPGIERFVHISSQAAGGPSGLDVPLDEDAPPRPITPYGRSKLEGEKRVLARKETIPVTIIRPPAVYGPRDRDIFIFFKLATYGLVPIPGFGTRKVSLIYVEDLVQGIRSAAGHPAARGKTYFISGGNHDWPDLAQALRDAVGRGRIVRVPCWVIQGAALLSEGFGRVLKKSMALNRHKARELIQPAWLCDSGRAEKEIGFRSAWPLERGMKKTAQWYREQRWI